ncbi:CarboxypepD_reg-like domain-containing protein [Paenimyroides aquimaris]|uniref:CarboxypepD_reg-like domain-containing protein n=1 Tax=Paenimyroides marinum TaxID=1159016 RepID=A0A1H6JG22_9FLAO|nr:carboxypeptidase-like regulatory domain-containing protein [Paenimyroides aquimaris]SEH61209.1 CarboxypepD_reg-like domain-containing protein [Paenimyroides aquimaris]
MKFSYLLLICLCGIYATAQNIQGIVTDKTTGKPLESAAVFFDNTTTATVTKPDGTFDIKIPLNNKNALIVSVVGYDYFIDANPSAGFLKIQLMPEDNVLEELIIDKNVFTRKQMLQAFRYFFIGNTKNGKRAKILNEDDLVFYYDTKTNQFSAYSDKPIVINNENLGYQLKFYLETFQVQFNYQTLDPENYVNSFYWGYSQFIETSKPKNKIIKNREETYKKSSAAFFKNLVVNNLESEDFILAVNGWKVDPLAYFKISNQGTTATLCVIQKPVRKTPVIDKNVFVNGVIDANKITGYKETEVPFTILNMKTKEQSIMYFQQECTQVSTSGQLLKPTDVLFGGFFGDLKTADMLPFDFTVAVAMPEIKTNNMETTKEMPAYADFEKEAIAFYTSENYNAHRKARKAFFDKLKVQYNDKVHEPFVLWIEENLKSTLFASKEEAITLHDNFVSTYKLINDQKEDIERKEDYFSKLYGEEEFGKMYYNKVIQGLLNKLVNTEKEN